jgi:hypothetical protein
MIHSIHFATFQASVPGISLALVGVFYLLSLLVRELRRFALKLIDAIRAVGKKYRAMKKELQLEGSDEKPRVRRKGCPPRKPVQSTCDTSSTEQNRKKVAR